MAKKFEHEIEYKDAEPLICTQRWILAFVFSAGFFFVFALRVNMSVALVCMVKPDLNISKSLELNNVTALCGQLEMQNDSNKNYERAEFDWDKETRSSILSAFFYGYIITQIPGGWLSDKFGGYRVFGVAMAVSGVCTVLLPVCARASLFMVYVLRFVLGVFQGVVMPSSYSLWSRWAPRYERTLLMAVSNVGAILGIVVTFATSGLLCDYGFDNGWASIFYLHGGFCCLWVLLWFYQIRDSPAEHPRINETEKLYIVNNTDLESKRTKLKVPWKNIATSIPVWALIICHSSGNWADYTLMTSLPAFMKEVLKFDIKSNGALSSLPYICMSVMSVIAGHLADTLRRKSIMTTTNTRKVLQTVAFIGSAVFLVATGFVSCEMRGVAVVFLCIALTFTGINSAAYAINHIDLAPKYAGLLMGITNTMATVPGMVSPIVAGVLTPNSTPDEWRNVFYVSAAFYVFGTLFFVVFGSGTLQPWAIDKSMDLNIEVSSNLISQDKETGKTLPKCVSEASTKCIHDIDRDTSV